MIPNDLAIEAAMNVLNSKHDRAKISTLGVKHELSNILKQILVNQEDIMMMLLSSNGFKVEDLMEKRQKI